MVAFKRILVLLSAVYLAYADCPPTDDDGSPLISSSTDGDFIVCTYQSARRCSYFSNGTFSDGSSVCPNGITPGSSGGSTTSQSSEGAPTESSSSSTTSTSQIESETESETTSSTAPTSTPTESTTSGFTTQQTSTTTGAQSTNTANQPGGSLPSFRVGCMPLMLVGIVLGFSLL